MQQNILYLSLEKNQQTHLPQTLPKETQASWSKEEDEYLLEKVQSKFKNNQKVSWKSLSSQLNSQFHAGNSERDRLKTRQRYYNCIDPNLKKGNWTKAEDLFIVLKKSQGLQWCKIKSYIQGRNDHQVKNRFYFLLKQFSKNDSYSVKMFRSQLQVTDFSDYILTYLQNEKNDKFKQIMEQRRKTQVKQEDVITSAFVVYNSEYKQQIALKEQQRLPNFNSLMYWSNQVSECDRLYV